MLAGWYNLTMVKQSSESVAYGSALPPALQRAIEDGVDLSLLIENLRLTPTQRVQRAQRMLDSVLALQSESAQWRGRQRSLK